MELTLLWTFKKICDDGQKIKLRKFIFFERKDAESQRLILNTEKTKKTKMHLAVLRAFKKISDDDQKIYSRKLKIIKPFGDCSSNGFSIYITLYTLYFTLFYLFLPNKHSSVSSSWICTFIIHRIRAACGW